MHVFKVNDRVRRTNELLSSAGRIPPGTLGTVVLTSSAIFDRYIRVRWDIGALGTYYEELLDRIELVIEEAKNEWLDKFELN